MNMEDRWEITETLSRFGLVIDGGGLDQLDTIFTPDAVYDMSAVGLPVMTGVDALREGALRLGAGNPVAHHVSNVVIVREETDQAEVDSKGLMLMNDGTLQSVVHHDVLRRGEAGWRIARRAIVPQRVPLGGLVSVDGPA